MSDFPKHHNNPSSHISFGDIAASVLSFALVAGLVVGMRGGADKVTVKLAHSLMRGHIGNMNPVPSSVAPISLKL